MLKLIFEKDTGYNVELEASGVFFQIVCNLTYSVILTKFQRAF